MNYLSQCILENQFQYLCSPLQVVESLLFTNGSGYDMVDNNLSMTVRFYRQIPYSQYYSDIKSLEDMKEIYLDRYFDLYAYESFKKLKSGYQDLSPELSDNKIEDKVYAEMRAEYKKVVFLDSNQMFNLTYWLDFILKSNWTPILSLSKGYGNIFQVVKDKSDDQLFLLAKTLVETYIDFYENYLFNPNVYKKYKSPSSTWTKAVIKDKVKQDLILLKDWLQLNS